MDNSFDRDLKRKLENQSPESLGFRPDRDKLWQQIESGKKKKTRLVPLWLSHTGAVAAGLLIAFFVLSRRAAEPEHRPMAVHVQPAIRTITDTVYAPATPQTVQQQPQVAAVATAPSGSRQKTAALPPAVVPRKGTATPEPPAPAQPEPVPVTDPKTEAPLVLAAAPRQHRKVMHLADMDNENTMSRPRQKNTPVDFIQLANLSQPESGQGSLAVTAAGRLFSKNKN